MGREVRAVSAESPVPEGKPLDAPRRLQEDLLLGVHSSALGQADWSALCGALDLVRGEGAIAR